MSYEFDESKHGPDMRESKFFLAIISFGVIAVVSLVAIASTWIFKVYHADPFEGLFGPTAFTLVSLWAAAALLVLKLLAPVEHIVRRKMARGEYHDAKSDAENLIQEIKDKIGGLDEP